MDNPIQAATSPVLTVGLLNVVGALIKVTPAIPNQWIPHALTACGVAGEILQKGASLEAVVNGAAYGLAAVGAHQLFVNSKPAQPQPPTQ